MKSMKRIKLLLFAVFAVMMLPAAVNAAAVGPKTNLNNGPETLEFFQVSDPTFEDGYIYPMTYTAPESGWYNVTADGALGLVLGYRYIEEDDDISDDWGYQTYSNDTVTSGEPALSYRDDPYRSGALCNIVYLEKDETWSFCIIGKYYGSSISKAATFTVNLIYKTPKITGVSVNKSTVKPGDTVTYNIVFDQNMETWEVTSVDLSEYIYGPNGQDIFTMSTYHKWEDVYYKVAGNTITYSYPVTKDDRNRVLKVDYIYLCFNELSDLTYANDTYRAWNGHNIFQDAGYIPGVPAVKFVTGNCYHTILSGWLYTAEQNGYEYQLCELCDYKKLLGPVTPVTCTHSWDSGKVTKPATYDTEGVKTYTCTKCGATKTSAIAKLIPKKDDVTVKEPITIARTPSSVKVKAKKNKVTVSWKKIKKNKSGKKLLKQIKSIQVQYSTDKAFKQNVKTKSVGKTKTKVKLKLQKKTTYYIRVRYKGANGFSKWSKVKKVKTKK